MGNGWSNAEDSVAPAQSPPERPEDEGDLEGQRTSQAAQTQFPPATPTPQSPAEPFVEKQCTISEIQLLSGHQDIVRHLLRLDDHRFASAGDDTSIVLWCFSSGEKLRVLTQHTRPVTCLLKLLSPSGQLILASGSSDRTIRLWDVDSGSCLNVLTLHTGAVTCMAAFGSATSFVSGANDRKLCLWTSTGEHRGNIERQEEENLHCMLPINSDTKILTGSNSSLLLVYKTETKNFDRLLAYHRESVRCLLALPGARFCSSSLDGAVVVWNSGNLTPLHTLNYHEQYMRHPGKVYLYAAQALVDFGENLIGVAIGHGFGVFDMVTGETICEMPDAHDADVSYLALTHGRTRIVTAAADSAVKVFRSFGLARRLNADISEFLEPVATPKSSMLRSGAKSLFGGGGSAGMIPTVAPAQNSGPYSAGAATVSPQVLAKLPLVELVAEFPGHTDSVNGLIKCTDKSFATCGADRLIILWKDSLEQSIFRSRYSALSLRYALWNSADEGQEDALPSMTPDGAVLSEFEDSDDSHTDDDVPQHPQQRKHRATFSSPSPGLVLDAQATSASPDYSQTIPPRSSRRNSAPAPPQPGLAAPLPKKRQKAQQNPVLSNKMVSLTPEQVLKLSAAPTADSAALRPGTASTGSGAKQREFWAKRAASSTTPDDLLLLTADPTALVVPTLDTPVPEHVWERAEMLRREQKLSLDEVAQHLREAGHSLKIIEEVMRRQQERCQQEIIEAGLGVPAATVQAQVQRGKRRD